MDVMSNDVRVPKSQNKNCKPKKRGGAKNNNNNKSLKVVYISSPMKVKTSPSRFRALVQELTGKNSDMSQFDDVRDFYEVNDLVKDTAQILSSEDNTPTSSDSFLGPIDDVPIDDVFMAQMAEQFGGIFSSRSLCEMDVLESYDELL